MPNPYGIPDTFWVDEAAIIDSESLYQRMLRDVQRSQEVCQSTRRTYRPRLDLTGVSIGEPSLSSFAYQNCSALVGEEPSAPKASNKRYHSISILFNKEKQIRNEV